MSNPRSAMNKLMTDLIVLKILLIVEGDRFLPTSQSLSRAASAVLYRSKDRIPRHSIK